MNGSNREKKGNVIPFPNVKERLIQFGTNALQNNEPDEAITFFEQALQYDDEDDRILVSLITAYMEVREWTNAKKLCQEMLNRGIGSYFMIFETYIKTLIELREYEEARKHISAILEEQKEELDLNIIQRLQNLLSFIENRKVKNVEPEPDQERTIAKLDDSYWFTHLHVFQQDIRPYIQDIKVMLADPERHPFIKTMMLHALIEQKYDESITVVKFNRSKSVVPNEELPFMEQPHFIELLSLLKERIESDNPTLFRNMKQLIERHFFILYPFSLLEQQDDVVSLACAYHMEGQRMLGIENNLDEMVDQYGANKSVVEKSMEQILFLETIPFPDTQF